MVASSSLLHSTDVGAHVGEMRGVVMLCDTKSVKVRGDRRVYYYYSVRWIREDVRNFLLLLWVDV